MDKLEAMKIAGIITEKDEKEYEKVSELLQEVLAMFPLDVIQYHKTKKDIKNKIETITKAIK